MVRFFEDLTHGRPNLSTSKEIESKWSESRRISRDVSPSSSRSVSVSAFSLRTPIEPMEMKEDLGEPIAVAPAEVEDFERRWSFGVIDPQTLPMVDDVDLRVGEVDIEDEVKMDEVVDLRGVVGEEEAEAEAEFEYEFALVEFMVRPRPMPRSRLWVWSNNESTIEGRGGGTPNSTLVGVSGQAGEVVEVEAEAETGMMGAGMGNTVSGSSSGVDSRSLKENKPRRLSLEKREDMRLAVLGVGDDAESRSWS